MTDLTVVGGGLAGLVASIASAEAGARVQLYEAHKTLGGRARSTDGAFVAHDGPHALYDDGPLWAWLTERDLVGPAARIPLRALLHTRFRWRGDLRRRPPLGVVRVLAGKRRRAPVDVDFRTWVAGWAGSDAAEAAAHLAGIATFHADPGSLSAAFVWERLSRIFGQPRARTRYVLGGWGTVLDRLEARARALGVAIETEARVDALPDRPVVVATSLAAARRLLDDERLTWPSGRAALLDVGLRAQRGDPFLIADLDDAAWVEQFSAPDPSVAPAGSGLYQAQAPLQPDEGKQAGVARLETLLDQAAPSWRDRVKWRRTAVTAGRTGAVDPPGATWRDRPAVDRGEGVFLAGDMVAATGLLSEVAFNSALHASRAALALRRSGAVGRVH